MNLHIVISLVGYLEPNSIRIEYKLSAEDQALLTKLPFNPDNAVEIATKIHATISRVLVDAKHINFTKEDQKDESILHIHIPDEYHI